MSTQLVFPTFYYIGKFENYDPVIGFLKIILRQPDDQLYAATHRNSTVN